MKKRTENTPEGSPQDNAQDRIMNAAREVFLRDGFKGARMQEIADLAGINKAMLHYYFRSKEKIFSAVFESVTRDFFAGMISSMAVDMPLEERLVQYSEKYIDFIKANPFVPAFIIHELNEGTDVVKKIFQNTMPKAVGALLGALDSSLKEFSPNTISARQLITNFISMAIFPIVAKPMLMINLGMGEEEYDEFIEERKKVIPKFIMAALKEGK